MDDDYESHDVLIVDVNGQDVTKIDLNEYSIVHKNKQKAYRDKLEREKERMLDTRGSFVQFKIEPNKNLYDFTIQQRRYIMELIPYVAFDRQPLQKVDKETGEIIYLTLKEIQEVFGLSRNKTADLMNFFVERGFFRKIQSETDKRKTHYIPTGAYFGKGKVIEKPEYMTKVFQRKLSEIIEYVKTNNIKERTNSKGD